MAFHPAGIGLYRAEDGRLFLQVINRRSEGNNTVEIFTLDGDRTTGFTLRHRGSVASTLFVHPAGIVAAGPESFYLTNRSEEHTSELQSLMRSSSAVFCLKKKNTSHNK